MTQFAQLSPLGQGNNSYRQVNYCAETASVLPLIPQDTAEAMEALVSIPDVAAQFGEAIPFLRCCIGMAADDPLTRSHFTLTPLGLKLLGYGCSKVSYVLLFTLCTR